MLCTFNLWYVFQHFEISLTELAVSLISLLMVFYFVLIFILQSFNHQLVNKKVYATANTRPFYSIRFTKRIFCPNFQTCYFIIAKFPMILKKNCWIISSRAPRRVVKNSWIRANVKARVYNTPILFYDSQVFLVYR